MTHHYVYVLQSLRDGHLYTGYTNNLVQRIRYHAAGKVFSTKHRLPVRLIYYEVCGRESDARAREKYLKDGPGQTVSAKPA